MYTREIEELNRIIQKCHEELSRAGVPDEGSLLSRVMTLVDTVEEYPEWLRLGTLPYPRCPICRRAISKGHKKKCPAGKVKSRKTITDDYQIWSAHCTTCGGHMQVVRPGKVQCEECG